MFSVFVRNRLHFKVRFCNFFDKILSVALRLSCPFFEVLFPLSLHYKITVQRYDYIQQYRSSLDIRRPWRRVLGAGAHRAFCLDLSVRRHPRLHISLAPGTTYQKASSGDPRRSDTRQVRERQVLAPVPQTCYRLRVHRPLPLH